MPELPEVEVTRRALAPVVEGRTLESVEVRERRLRWPVPDRLGASIAGHRVERIGRRGKYLLWHFERGTLISHLGMSGAWRIWPRAQPVPPPRIHDHVDLLFRSHCIRMTDPRRFGALLWAGGHPPKVEPEVLEAIAALEGDYASEMYFSLSCHNCTDVVQALTLMALTNPRISATLIEGGTFKDEVDTYFARQLVSERLMSLELPEGIERPELGPIATGLGEVFHYVVRSDNTNRTFTELRELQDWVIKPQLRKVAGVA